MWNTDTEERPEPDHRPARRRPIHDDGPTCKCGAVRSERVTCDPCGAFGIVANCGCMSQPRPIAAGLPDGRDMQRTYCSRCAEEYSRAH